MQTLLDQLVYFGFFQSLFLLSIYLFSPKNRKSINGYLVVFVALLAVGLTGRVVYIANIVENNYRWVIFSEFSTLLFGATIFLFTRSSLRQKPFAYSDLIHYVPALIFNIFVTFIFLLPNDEELLLRTQSGAQYRYTLILVGIGLCFNITYWLMSLKIFLQFRKDLQDELSYSVKSQFFLNFLIAIGLCLVCWVTMYLGGFFHHQLFNRSPWQIVWMSIAVILLFIAFYSIKEPELFKVTPLVDKTKYTQSKLSIADLETLKVQLDTLMQKKKPYLNRKLLKSELAEMLGISNPEIARLLNESIGMNFFEYVNYYRIKEFIELAKTDKAKNLSLFGLAQEAGFNSKTTFNKSFKKLMGTSPSAYLKL